MFFQNKTKMDKSYKIEYRVTQSGTRDYIVKLAAYFPLNDTGWWI